MRDYSSMESSAVEIERSIAHHFANEYMGNALGLDFFVHRFQDNCWVYYGNMQIVGEIQSERFTNSVQPSPSHWAQWVVSTIVVMQHGNSGNK